MKIYIGYDPRDDLAYKVAETSLRKYSSIDLIINKISEPILRKKGCYWRTGWWDHNGQMFDNVDKQPFSTQFSFSRFGVPYLEEYGDEWVMFTDPDTMWRTDIAELVKLIDPTKAVMCVHHNQQVTEKTKMDNVIQSANTHGRKNWSSVMLLKPSQCNLLTTYALNNMSGSWLHGMLWVQDEMIGSIPEEWNYLVGHSNPKIDPKLCHFTYGTPDIVQVPEYEDEWWSYAKIKESYE